jgi:hypothetical protein
MPKDKTSRSAARQQRVAIYGVGKRPGKASARKKGVSKGTYLQEIALTHGLSLSPVGRLSLVSPSDVISKVDAPHAGDHSPSISAVNKTPDRVHGISGRSSFKGTFQHVTREQDVPTLQFSSHGFGFGDDRDPVKGSAAHSMFTSLREMHGVGESHSVRSFSEVLDKTLQAYSPYGPDGEPDRGGVSLPRVNAYAESSKGPVLHRSKSGVAPMVAQAMINLHYRDPAFLSPGRGVPSMVSDSHEAHAKLVEARKASSSASLSPMSEHTVPKSPGLSPMVPHTAPSGEASRVKRSATESAAPPNKRSRPEVGGRGGL